MPVGVYPHRRRPVAERFWEKVAKSDTCWEWTGAQNAQGYGKLSAGSRGAPYLRAHRVAWELANGPIPAGLWVLHRCDNPPCVRPDHLWLGTRAENMADCAAKGRTNTLPARRARLRNREQVREYLATVAALPEGGRR